MPFPLIPLAVGAFGAIGALIKRRRAAQAFAGGSFTQSRPVPTSGISDTTTGPNTAQTAAGAANTGVPQTNKAQATTTTITGVPRTGKALATGPDRDRTGLGQAATAPATSATGPQQGKPDLSGLAAQLGEESKRKARQKNLDQRASLAQSVI